MWVTSVSTLFNLKKENVEIPPFNSFFILIKTGVDMKVLK